MVDLLTRERDAKDRVRGDGDDGGDDIQQDNAEVEVDRMAAVVRETNFSMLLIEGVV